MNNTIYYFQKGFNYSQDGPGNRLVYHLLGCNMNCPWCANPEGLKLDAPLMVKQKPLLDYICDKGAIKDGDLNRDVCAGCADQVCITKNRNTRLVSPKLSGSLEDIFNDIMSCRDAFSDGGGVTFTGGEVSLQTASLISLCDLLRGEGIHITIETNGSTEDAKKLYPHIDYLIIDYKHYDRDALKKTTGANLSTIEDSIKAALNYKFPIIIRILLIHGFNDSQKDIEGFISSLKNIIGDLNRVYIEFLEYHEFGKVKWEQCGLEYKMQDAFVNKDTVLRFRKSFTDSGFKLIIT